LAGKMLGMVATAPNKLAGLRDRALLLIGFGGALRRSELVALDVADIEETETGLLVKIRGSKTDQERAGATIAIAKGDNACPAKALRAWLDAAGIEAGRSSARSTRAARYGPGGLPAVPSLTS
jgi:site-specific recombinase XerC